MQLSLLNDQQISQLKINLYEVARRSHQFVILKFTHNLFPEILTELELTFLPCLSYQSYLLSKLPVTQFKRSGMEEQIILFVDPRSQYFADDVNLQIVINRLEDVIE